MQLTNWRAGRPQVSADGHWIYYAKHPEGVRRFSVRDGSDELFSPIAGAWTIAKEGGFFISKRGDTAGASIIFRNAASRETNEIYKIDGSPYSWMAVSPDGRSILYDRFEHTSSDIMLVENFR